MSFLLRRAPYQGFITAHWQEQMDRIEGCQHCGQCIRQCPYSLDTPEILTTMLADYRSFLASHSVGQ
jgi:predicted aldo/keto reductase-like oxidoreductase